MSITYTSLINAANKRLKKAQLKAVKEAAKYLRSELKNTIALAHGKQSDLYKGVRFRRWRDEYIVGMSRPAYMAHWLEFGTDDRYTKDGVYRGFVPPQPYFRPTLEREKNEIKKIIIDNMKKL